MKLNKVSWSCEAPIGNLTDSSISCHDNLLILFDRFVELSDALFITKQWTLNLVKHCRAQGSIQV